MHSLPGTTCSAALASPHPSLTPTGPAQESAINTAKGEAESIQRRAEATATGIRVVSEAISRQAGNDAVSLRLAEQYIEAFGKIAKAGNTLIVPADASNVASMVAQAASVFSRVSASAGGSEGRGEGSDGAGSGDQASGKAQASGAGSGPRSSAEDAFGDFDSYLNSAVPDTHNVILSTPKRH